MKGENRNNPAIDAGTGSDIWVREHAFDIPGVDFDDKISNADKVESKGSEGAIKTVKFEFWLRKTRFAGIKGNRTESRKMSFANIVGIALGEEKSYSDVRSVDGEYDGGLRSVVDGANGGRTDKGEFEVFLCCDLFGTEFEWLVFTGEFDDSCSAMSEISNKNSTNSNSSEKHFDFGKSGAGTPIANCVDASRVCHASVYVAFMT